MNATLTRLAAACAVACVSYSPLLAETAAPASFADALTQGKFSIAARLRYEHVDQDAANDADALTLGLNVGYTTQSYLGFQAGIEGEGTTPLVDNYYDATGANPNGYAVIGDPEIYEVNQAWLSYTTGKTTAKVGRQRIVLDNARFVGDVGWRQNQQTYDAVLLQDKSLAGLTLTYAYLAKINRVFDDNPAQYDWQSDSHLLNASYSGWKAGTLTAYAYLLDFDRISEGARNNSSQTYGVSFAGAAPFSEDIKATYRFEYARQSDYGSSLLDYAADYGLVELGLAAKPIAAALGYELLGGDNGSGFKTPLATLHAFNGWADKFLGTPGVGLTDLYLKISAPLPGGLKLLAFYHEFGTDDGPSDLGHEFDLQLAYKINKSFSVTAKAAYFNAEQSNAVIAGANRDATKFWLQTDYTF